MDYWDENHPVRRAQQEWIERGGLSAPQQAELRAWTTDADLRVRRLAQCLLELAGGGSANGDAPLRDHLRQLRHQYLWDQLMTRAEG